MLPFERPGVIDYSTHLINSFRRQTGKMLLASAPPHVMAKQLYHAPFVVVSHGTEPDPIFCYANLTAQKLWEMEWETFTALPSRLSAEPGAREDRERFLRQAEEKGYVDNYAGIRVTATGRRFRIKDCILWNVVDAMGERIGQAATFKDWELL